MNERIKQIALECYNPYSNFDYEKFAEMIVRDCAKVADIADENKCEWIGGNILTHFGVEQ